jgi:hypothetical protein
MARPSPTRHNLIQPMIYLTMCLKQYTPVPHADARWWSMETPKLVKEKCKLKYRMCFQKYFVSFSVWLANNRRSRAGNSRIYMLTFPFLQQKAGPSPGNLFALQNSQFLAFFRVCCFFGRSLYTASYWSEYFEGNIVWQNQPELYRLKYVSPFLRALTCFKRYNPLACRVTSR